ncbi:MAG: peptidoglycan recognition protein family protein [Firmicutes bacterium]|nr:peptidoglycan recognition protein family protein [Bacillota bacterium]
MTERPLSEIKFLVLHHSVTSKDATIDQIREMHIARGYSDIGYHYLINSGGLKEGRGIGFRGAHALSEKAPYLNTDMNRAGVGLCIIGDFSEGPPDDALINEAAFTVKRIAGKLGIKLDRKHIIPHGSVSYTACPGKGTMEKLYAKLEI